MGEGHRIRFWLMLIAALFLGAAIWLGVAYAVVKVWP